MANITTAFTAKDNLVALIKTLNDPKLVYYGHPGQDVPDAHEWVWVGEIEWDSDEPIALGYTASPGHNEIYRIIVTFESHVPDDTQLDANNRVKTKLYALQQAFRASNNPLTLPNPISVRIEPQFLGEGQNQDAGRGAIMVVTVRVEARV